MIQTFIYEPNNLDDQTITIAGSEARHMISVLRLKKGDSVRLIDGQGTAHICEIVSPNSRQVICSIIKTLKRSGEPTLLLTLAIGLSTGSKFDTVVEKGVEVGISRFMPLLTEKGKVKVGDPSAITSKMKRWRRVAKAAAKQSSRSLIPLIERPVNYSDFLTTCDPGRAILFHPDNMTDDMLSIVDTFKENSLTVIIGPESGFSATEIDQARTLNIPIISMGPRMLRTETAGIVLPALFIYQHKLVKR